MYFFDFRSPLRYPISTAEKLIPLLLCFLCILLLLGFADRIRASRTLDFGLRISMGLLLFLSLFLEYSLRYIQVGINRRSLPLHLCSFAAVLCCVLTLTCSKRLFQLVFSGGIPGSVVAILGHGIGRASNHIQYYTFMLLHLLIILIPIYFYAVYEYRITLKSHVCSILLLQGFALVIPWLNDTFGTFYWYLTYTRNMFAGTNLSFLGGGLTYFLIVEGLALVMFASWYGLYMLSNTIYQRYEQWKQNA